MPNDDRTRIIYSRTPESAAMLANVKRAMAITATLNRLTFNDADEIRTLFSELIGKKVDESFLLIPPFYTAGGDEIRVGHNVFVNQNCTFYDLGGLDIADDVMIGPNVSIITTGHPLEPSQRRAATIGKPIAIEKSVWIAAGATIIGGVTVGELSRRGGFGSHQGRSPEYPCRRKSGESDSFDWRLREPPRWVEAGTSN
jgi:acetyltransferase-like isoleucine patch superfamily enzyme